MYWLLKLKMIWIRTNLSNKEGAIRIWMHWKKYAI